VDGVLFAPTPEGIAGALGVLGDPGEIERLAANARAAGERWLVAPEEYATRMRELVER
jgi:hypothetical protein